jgi:hypothetical protein
MGSVKECTDSVNTGERGVGVKVLGHETVSYIPCLALKKIVRFRDLGAAAE